MKYLESNTEIASGHLVIKGTRIRIVHVFRLIAEGVSIEDIHKDWYPWLSVSKIRGAVDEALKQFEQISSSPNA